MIFISHKKEDSNIALFLSNLLKERGIKTYVDELDPTIQYVGNSYNITEHIINSLNKCSHLIVVFTDNTKDSMWVPFELGAAYQADKRIGTFLINHSSIKYKNNLYNMTKTLEGFDENSLPEYLLTYPIMLNNGSDIYEYIDLYNEELVISRDLNKSMIEKRANTYNAQTFINELKSKLGQ